MSERPPSTRNGNGHGNGGDPRGYNGGRSDPRDDPARGVHHRASSPRAYPSRGRASEGRTRSLSPQRQSSSRLHGQGQRAPREERQSRIQQRGQARQGGGQGGGFDCGGGGGGRGQERRGASRGQQRPLQGGAARGGDADFAERAGLRHDVSQLSSRLEDQHKHTQYLKESNSDLADKMADVSMQVRIECSSY